MTRRQRGREGYGSEGSEAEPQAAEADPQLLQSVWRQPRVAAARSARWRGGCGSGEAAARESSWLREVEALEQAAA